MKKILILAFAIMLIAGTAFGQYLQKHMIVPIPTRSSTFGVQVKVGDFVYIVADSTMYISKGTFSGATTGTYFLASPSRYSVANMTTFSAKVPSYFVDTVQNQNVHGVKTFYDAPSSNLGGSTTNTGYGLSSSGKITSGTNNTAFGNSTLKELTTGLANTAIGYRCLEATTSGGPNVAIGTHVLLSNTSGTDNVGIGSMNLYLTTTAESNVAIGSNSMMTATTASSNAALGTSTLGHITTGNYNTAIGWSALQGLKSGHANIALGKFAGPSGTTADISNKLYISNKIGGQDTAFIYGEMEATASASKLQINANTTTQKLTLQADTAVTDPLYTIAVKSGHVYVKVALTGSTSARWKQIDN